MTTDKPQPQIQSFEVADGDTFGDILSANRIRSGRKLKIGLFSGAFFEFWRMFPDLKNKVEQDNNVVLEHLSEHQIVCSGVVDTLDAADEAGKHFRDEQIDLLILAYRTYIPDVYVHHMLGYLSGVPILFFASQSRDRFDYQDNYEGVMRNSGIMAKVQLVAGFRKMNNYEHMEVVTGSIHDEEAYREINSYIKVVTIYKQLQNMTIGVIGNVFRGMHDFEYDKAKIKGALGPEILNIQMDHFTNLWETADSSHGEVQAMIKHVKQAYEIDSAVGEDDLIRASRVSVALEMLVEKFHLDGVALLLQHFLEVKVKTTASLGLSEMARKGDVPGSVEGDVIGLIMMKILKHLTGNSAYFFEWSEFDIEHNAWMLLGHGFGDPSQARDKPKLTPCAEQWGLEGVGCSLEFVPKPGPCTMAHFIEDARGWRKMISGGEILDLPPLPIHDTHAFVKVDRPIKEYVNVLTNAGVPHHAITVRGDVRKQLHQLADLMGIEKVVI